MLASFVPLFFSGRPIEESLHLASTYDQSTGESFNVKLQQISCFFLPTVEQKRQLEAACSYATI